MIVMASEQVKGALQAKAKGEVKVSPQKGMQQIWISLCAHG